MDYETRMFFKPEFDRGRLVSAIIIEDQMQRCFARKFPVDAAEELQELLMPVTLVAVTDDLAM